MRGNYVGVERVMSHFLIGEFVTNRIIESEQRTYGNKDIYYYFNQKTDLCKDVCDTVKENVKLPEHDWFLITSKLQGKNSDDVLFPYDKYSNEELFPSDGDREFFEEKCISNLRLLFESLSQFIEDMNPVDLRIIIVQGYDTVFKEEKCTLETMFEDLQNQAINTYFLDSKIYNIVLP